MASIIDIGRSAINAQKDALNVTSQNIANVNTEGYHRRKASTEEIAQSSDAITIKSKQTGLGVRIGEIKRAFDAIFAERGLNANARFQSTSSYLDKISQIEDLILPSEGDIGQVISRFITALNQISVAPGDIALRETAILEGDAVAKIFNNVSGLLNGLAEQIEEARGSRLEHVLC